MKKKPTATVKEMRALANKAEDAAEDAASYATSAKYCLIATQIALAVVIIISLYSR